MIEVTAKLPGRSVFLAGETIQCSITFKNAGKLSRQSFSPPKNRSCKLAWASAQIHCQSSVSESRVDVSQIPEFITATVSTSSTDSDTSFVPLRGEKGCTVLSTKPIILFCDLTLAPGDSSTYTYKETIPHEAPPTFRGTAVKYSYKITIGTQKFDCPTKLLRVPFRVLVSPGGSAVRKCLHDLSVYQDPDEVKPSNPFHRSEQPQTTLLEVALEILQNITCRKAAHTYNITNARGRVAKFCLFRQAYRIGDDIVGTFDFSEASIPCVRFSVSLQTEENVSEDCRKKTKESPMMTCYSKHEEFCLHSCRCHINVPIPLTATPTFGTDIVSLRWKLHFEFVTSKNQLLPEIEPDSPADSSTWRGPAYLDVETMIWDLPIKVFATNPMYASSVSLLQTDVAGGL